MKTNEQYLKSCRNRPLTVMGVTLCQLCGTTLPVALPQRHCFSHRGTTCCQETWECSLPCAWHPLLWSVAHLPNRLQSVSLPFRASLLCSDQCYSKWIIPLIFILMSQRAIHFLLTVDGQNMQSAFLK